MRRRSSRSLVRHPAPLHGRHAALGRSGAQGQHTQRQSTARVGSAGTAPCGEVAGAALSHAGMGVKRGHVPGARDAMQARSSSGSGQAMEPVARSVGQGCQGTLWFGGVSTTWKSFLAHSGDTQRLPTCDRLRSTGLSPSQRLSRVRPPAPAVPPSHPLLLPIRTGLSLGHAVFLPRPPQTALCPSRPQAAALHSAGKDGAGAGCGRGSRGCSALPASTPGPSCMHVPALRQRPPSHHGPPRIRAPLHRETQPGRRRLCPPAAAGRRRVGRRAPRSSAYH